VAVLRGISAEKGGCRRRLGEECGQMGCGKERGFVFPGGRGGGGTREDCRGTVRLLNKGNR